MRKLLFGIMLALVVFAAGCLGGSSTQTTTTASGGGVTISTIPSSGVETTTASVSYASFPAPGTFTWQGAYYTVIATINHSTGTIWNRSTVKNGVIYVTNYSSATYTGTVHAPNTFVVKSYWSSNGQQYFVMIVPTNAGGNMNYFDTWTGHYNDGTLVVSSKRPGVEATAYITIVGIGPYHG